MVDFIKIFEIFNIVFLGGWTKDQIKIKIKILTAIKEELLRQKKIVKALCDWLETFPQPNPLKEYLKKKVGYSWSIVQNNWSTSGKMQVQIEGTLLARWYQKQRKTDYRFDWKFQ